MKYLFIFLLFGIGCNGVDKKDDHTRHEPRPIYLSVDDPYIIDSIRQSLIGVFQNVVYSDSHFYLDTWAQTEARQSHKHMMPMLNGGIMSMGGGYQFNDFPYDSLAHGSFNYIKSIKKSQYDAAKKVFDYEIKVGIEERRKADSTKKAYEERVDSVKMLNALK